MFFCFYLCFIITYSLIQREYIPKDFSDYSLLKYFFKQSYYLGVEGGIGGGVIGNILTSILLFLFGVKGSYIIAYTIAVLAILLTTDLSLLHIGRLFTKSMKVLFAFVAASVSNLFSSNYLNKIIKRNQFLKEFL